jgi:hypothetical protein
MNSTQKLDDIRRRIRRIETRLDVIQRANVMVFERIIGPMPEGWLVTTQESKILDAGDASRRHARRHPDRPRSGRGSPCNSVVQGLLMNSVVPKVGNAGHVLWEKYQIHCRRYC